MYKKSNHFIFKLKKIRANYIEEYKNGKVIRNVAHTQRCRLEY